MLADICRKYGKSAAQVALRWNTQRGVVAIPKSTHRERMAQNLDIWDFTLTDEEMASMLLWLSVSTISTLSDLSAS